MASTGPPTTNLSVLLATALLVVLLAGHVWRHRAMPGANAAMVLLALIAAWALLRAIELASTDVVAKLLWYQLASACYPLIGASGFCLALEYAGCGHFLTRRNLVLLVVPSLTYVVLALTSDAHQLLWTRITVDGPAHGSRTALTWAFVACHYALYVVGTVLLLRFYVRWPPLRRSVALLIVGLYTPCIVDLLKAERAISASPFDPMIAANGFSALMITMGAFRARILDLKPAALNMAVAHSADGVVVVDAQNRVIFLNPTAQRLLDSARSAAVGQDAPRNLAQSSNMLALAKSAAAGDKDLSVGTDPEVRHYQVRISPFQRPGGGQMGQLILLRDVTETRRAQEQLVDQQRALATLEERERVARELHDGLGQVLGYVKVQTQAARDLISIGDGRAADSHLAQLASVAQEAHIDVREYIRGAQAVTFAKGFIGSLREHVAQFAQNSGVAARLDVSPELGDSSLEPTVQVQVVRIMQEALTNVRKHARARSVRVELIARGNEAQVTIRDDGQGFDPAQVNSDVGRRFGLRVMGERAASVGGSLEVCSASGNGTQVIFRVPLRKEEA